MSGYNSFQGYNVFTSGAAFEFAPELVNSLSITNNPAMTFSSAFNFNPDVVATSSLALEPSITYIVNGALNMNIELTNTSSIARTPVISFGQSQIIGSVVVGYAADLYTVTFKE